MGRRWGFCRIAFCAALNDLGNDIEVRGKPTFGFNKLFLCQVSAELANKLESKWLFQRHAYMMCRAVSAAYVWKYAKAKGPARCRPLSSRSFHQLGNALVLVGFHGRYVGFFIVLTHDDEA